MASPPVPLLLLPPEIHLHILHHLPPFDQGSLNATCKATHTLVSSTQTTLKIQPAQPPPSSPLPLLPRPHFPALLHLTLHLLPTSSTTPTSSFLSWFTPRHAATLHHLHSLKLLIGPRPDEGRTGRDLLDPFDSPEPKLLYPTLTDWQQAHLLLQQCPNLRQLEVGAQPVKGIARLVLREGTPGQGLRHHQQLLVGVLALYPGSGDCDNYEEEDDPCPEDIAADIVGKMLESQACCSNNLLELDIPALELGMLLTDDDEQPAWMQALHAVQHPDLADYLPLQQLTALTRLNGTAIDADGIAALGSLTRLVDLECTPPRHNLPHTWSQLCSLRRLTMHVDPHFTPSPSFSYLTALDHLALNFYYHHACLSFPTSRYMCLSVLSALISLHMWNGHREWEGVLSVLPTSLRELSFSWMYRPPCPQWMPPHSFSEGWDSLSRLSLLSALSTEGSFLNYSNTGPFPIATLTSLQRLFFRHIRIEDADTEQLSSLTHLTHLTLGTAVANAGRLWPALDTAGRLRELCMHQIGAWPEVIPSSVTLLHVSVAFKGDLPAQLVRCRELRELQTAVAVLHETPIILTGIAVVQHLTSLRKLRLEGIEAGVDVGCVDALTRLTSVTLRGASGCRVRCGGWPRLRALGRLREVTLRGFEDPLPLEDLMYLRDVIGFSPPLALA